MIIWGSKGKLRTLSQGQFFCPYCQKVTGYQHKRVARYFTLYFIALFQTENLGEFIECQSCCFTFKMEVLNLTQSLRVEQEKQQLEAKKVIDDLREALTGGASLQSVKSMIKASGGNEEVALAVLAAATEGKVKYCKNCGTQFIEDLSFCSVCGTPLSCL
jgi:hypothetical protein